MTSTPLLLLLAAVCSASPASRAPGPAAQDSPAGPFRIERVTTAVPWPRGVRSIDGKLYALARGVHRSAGNLCFADTKARGVIHRIRGVADSWGARSSDSQRS